MSQLSSQELDHAVNTRQLVQVRDDAPRYAGVTGFALGINFYGPQLNVKIGLTDQDGNYTGEWTKVPAEWLRSAS